MHSFHLQNKTIKGDLIFISILHIIILEGQPYVQERMHLSCINQKNMPIAAVKILPRTALPSSPQQNQTTSLCWGWSYLHTNERLNETFQLCVTLPSHSTITLWNLYYLSSHEQVTQHFTSGRKKTKKKMFFQKTTNYYSSSGISLTTTWSKLVTHSASDFTQ